METKQNIETPQPRLSNKEKIIQAIGINPNQDPCVTIEGELIQTGESHVKLALQLIDMVLDKEIQRTQEGWQVLIDSKTTSPGD